jgi:O-antigen/teichoic acid export membrane protein
MNKAVVIRMAVVSLPKVLKLLSLILVDALMARYLGVAQFGLFSFVFGIFIILNTLPKFGLDDIIVRDRVGNEMSGGALAHVLLARLLGALVATVSFALMVLLTPSLWPFWPYLIVLGFTYALSSVSVFESLLQAGERFSALAAAQSVVVLCSAGLKLTLVWIDASVEVFWTSIFIEGAVSAAITLLVLLKTGMLGQILAVRSFSLVIVKDYIRQGFPFLLASVSVIFYMRADQLMLTWMVGVESVGLYSAALRISESFFTLATIACIVLFPSLLRLRIAGKESYERGFVLLFRGFLIAGLGISLALTYGSDFLILRLFGEGYRGSSWLLVLHAWVMVPAFWGIVSHRWLVAEKLGRFELIRTGIGLALNLLLNLALIPYYGAAGACVATLISQFFAYVALNYMIPSLSGLARMQMHAVLALHRG